MAFTRSGVRFPSPPSGGPAPKAGVGDPAGGADEFAGIAQLVEHNLAKVGVAGSSPVSRFQRQRQLSLTARYTYKRGKSFDSVSTVTVASAAAGGCEGG
jgi:hypothetical protein